MRAALRRPLLLTTAPNDALRVEGRSGTARAIAAVLSELSTRRGARGFGSATVPGRGSVLAFLVPAGTTETASRCVRASLPYSASGSRAAAGGRAGHPPPGRPRRTVSVMQASARAASCCYSSNNFFFYIFLLLPPSAGPI